MQPLLGGPRAHLPEPEVVAALRLEHAPLVRHGVIVLDSRDRETGEVANVDQAAGDVSWSFRAGSDVTQAATSAAVVRRTATVRLVGTPTFPLEARRLLLWTEIQAPSGVWVRFHQGVFVIANPEVRDDGTLVTRDLVLADKTSRYDALTLPTSLQIQAGTEPVGWVRAHLAAQFGETRFAFVANTAALREDMTFEASTSLLAVYNALLGAVGYDGLTTDEDGRPQARPLSAITGQAPEVTYGPGAAPIVTAGSLAPLLPTLPNVVRFVARQGPTLPELGNGIAERRNASTGPASILARGEEVPQTVEVDADSQAALEAVADAEAQRYFAGGGLSFRGQVGLNPRFSDRDVIGLVKPRLGLLAGAWVVTEWTYPRRAVTGEGDVLMGITCEQRVEAA